MRLHRRAENSGWAEISADRGPAALARLLRSKRHRRMARRTEIPGLAAHRKAAVAVAIAVRLRRAVVDRMAAVRLTAETTADSQV
jgi:hypothetical protein